MIDAVIPAVPERSPAKKNAVGRGACPAELDAAPGGSSPNKLARFPC